MAGFTRNEVLRKHHKILLRYHTLFHECRNYNKSRANKYHSEQLEKVRAVLERGQYQVWMHWVVDPDSPASTAERELSEDCLAKVISTQQALDDWLTDAEYEFARRKSGSSET